MPRSRFHAPATTGASRAAAHQAGPAGSGPAGGARLVAQRRLLETLLPPAPALQREVGMDDTLLDDEEPGQLKADPGGLPADLQAGIAAVSGHDLSDVAVHRNSSAPRQLNALAYAQGQDIHLGPGQEQHLPHEAWHLVQQRQGRVQPSVQMQGVAINDDPALEQEANTMGARAAQAGPAAGRDGR
jgi:hypothetical protein